MEKKIGILSTVNQIISENNEKICLVHWHSRKKLIKNSYSKSNAVNSSKKGLKKRINS